MPSQIGILVFYSLVIAALLVVILVLSWLLGERHKDKATDEPFESGVLHTGTARLRFSAQFYLVAMLFVIFDKADGLRQRFVLNPNLSANFAVQQDIGPAIPNPSTGPNEKIVEGATQELGVFLFQKHLVNVELAGLILTISMIGAIVIARRRVIGETALAGGEVLVAPATPIDDNPHSIPVVGTRNPRQKEYPET